MMIHDITKLAGQYRRRKRVGRGRASGVGKTSGRGHKGHSSRSGFASRAAFEGGQMPYFRRIPKRGFTNARFRTRFWTVNLGDILAHPAFADGGEVDAARLIDAGLIRDQKRPLKILGDLKDRTLDVKLTVTAHRVSQTARRRIEEAGGAVVELGSRRDRVRGVDRASGDPTPRNLTKKLKRHLRKLKQEQQGAAASEKQD